MYRRLVACGNTIGVSPLRLVLEKQESLGYTTQRSLVDDPFTHFNIIPAFMTDRPTGGQTDGFAISVSRYA